MKAQDLATNFIWLRALVMHCSDRVASAFFLADGLLG